MLASAVLHGTSSCPLQALPPLALIHGGAAGVPLSPGAAAERRVRVAALAWTFVASCKRLLRLLSRSLGANRERR